MNTENTNTDKLLSLIANSKLADYSSQADEGYLYTIETPKSYGDVEMVLLIHVYDELDTMAELIVEEDTFDIANFDYTIDELLTELNLADFTKTMNKGICTIQTRNVKNWVFKTHSLVEKTIKQ